MSRDIIAIVAARLFSWFSTTYNFDVAPLVIDGSQETQRTYSIKNRDGRKLLSFKLTKQNGTAWFEGDDPDWAVLRESQRRKQAEREWPPKWLRMKKSGVNHDEQLKPES